MLKNFQKLQLVGVSTYSLYHIKIWFMYPNTAQLNDEIRFYRSKYIILSNIKIWEKEPNQCIAVLWKIITWQKEWKCVSNKQKILTLG